MKLLFLQFWCLFIVLSSFVDNDFKIVSKRCFISKSAPIMQEEEKPIIIAFHAAWSANCQRMRRDIWSDEDVLDFIADHFENIQVNIESSLGTALADYYHVHELPTIIIISPNGVLIEKNMRSIDSPQQFMDWARSARESYILQSTSENNQKYNYIQNTHQAKEEKYKPKLLLLTTK